jgi:Cof subfamily protein (haloacid dehalogenase superfamily)
VGTPLAACATVVNVVDLGARPLPKLIAFDLDGTLLDPNGQLTQRSIVALQTAAAAGITLVFASGRPPFVAAREIEAVNGAVRYGVMANGAIVCTLPDAQVLRSISFETATAIDAALRLRASDPRFGFALASDRHFAAEDGFFERMPVHGQVDPVPDALVGHEGSEQTIKLLVFHHDHGAMELLRRIPTIIGGALIPTHMGAEAVELGPPGADKGTGLAWLCGHLGIEAAEVMAFGDEVNDLPMFAFAGHAVAVANAAPSVVAAADEVCESNADDGVARCLERLLGSPTNG